MPLEPELTLLIVRVNSVSNQKFDPTGNFIQLEIRYTRYKKEAHLFLHYFLLIKDIKGN